MKPTNNSSVKNNATEPAGLRILRILTVLMTIVMIIGFIWIVSLLSIAIKKNIAQSHVNSIHSKFPIANNEILSSITYSSDFTILLITNNDNRQVLRILSNKTGKILSDSLVSDLVTADSKE